MMAYLNCLNILIWFWTAGFKPLTSHGEGYDVHHLAPENLLLTIVNMWNSEKHFS